MNHCQCPSETANSTKQAEAIYRPQFHTSTDAQGATVRVALPGVRKEDLNLTLHETNLKIGAKRANTGTSGPSAYALDLRLGQRFDGTGTTATLEAGILTLKVPVREESKPRQIAVN